MCTAQPHLPATEKLPLMQLSLLEHWQSDGCSGGLGGDGEGGGGEGVGIGSGGNGLKSPGHWQPWQSTP